MAHTAHSLPDTASVSSRTLEILSKEGNLPICTACGTQYGSARDTCMICEDPRQAVPPTGQTWTSLTQLSSSRRNTILEDTDDHRVKFIGTEAGFAINQTPILLETAEGSYIWDCSAYISTALIHYLSKELRTPLRGIAISHPHFFSTSLTWSRLLGVPLYLNEADKAWYVRLDEIGEGDKVVWWTGEREIGKGLRLIQCGGHFPGSSVLHWDRLQEPAPTDHPTKRTPVSGLLLVADTVMVQPTQRGFTFIWSVPNMIPLGPKDVRAIQHTLASLPFSQATSSWPNRFIRENAREILSQSVASHLRAMGWEMEGKEGELVPA
ncbi:uncharacterized protein MKK02DRAFT_19982 [Dioszegia hungarica]|uniref:Metallo-beta-lactamase domain-containing protein n=1 Tax=Dioszegia hungarica TaxID=4972 RepID=A0AA38H5J6_9TREE|nr:uncharacterized protein MKK02DRAFT_19982 [Dioszegia hungarica]KAI9632904.1 hypothetical protein MKK02DRAFT_19982 [Dioszegia hungarica]